MRRGTKNTIYGLVVAAVLGVFGISQKDANAVSRVYDEIVATIKGPYTLDNNSQYFEKSSEPTIKAPAPDAKGTFKFKSLRGKPWIADAIATKDTINKQGAERNTPAKAYTPPGWHRDYIDGKPYVNRSHMLAYTNFVNMPNLNLGMDNKDNLFTGTAGLNQDKEGGMLKYELAINNYIKETGNPVHVLVELIYDDDGNQMPNALNMQAVSSDGKLSFNVVLNNVVIGHQIDYRTGELIK